MKKSKKNIDIFDYPSRIAEVLYSEHKFDLYEFGGSGDFYISGISIAERASGDKKKYRGLRNSLTKEIEVPSKTDIYPISGTRIINDKSALLSIVELGDRLLDAGLLLNQAQFGRMSDAFSEIKRPGPYPVELDPKKYPDNVKKHYFSLLKKDPYFSKEHLNKLLDVFLQENNEEIDTYNEYIKFAKYFYYQVFREIEEWVNEYGLPFYDYGKFTDMEFGGISSNAETHLCSLDAFVDWLINLHYSFYIWRYVQYNEEVSLLKKEDNTLKYFASYFSDNHMGDGIQYKLVYQEETDSIGFYWTSDNLFSVVELQFALLASSKDPDGKSIKKCGKCGDWFEASNNNEIYCKKRPGCNAKSVAQARWRKNKKSVSLK
jgi:hypothetical protein